MSIWQELGISGGTVIIVLIALYFIVKWAVKNGIKEAYREINGKNTAEDIETSKVIEEIAIDRKKRQN